jgi:hypothetical protein
MMSTDFTVQPASSLNASTGERSAPPSRDIPSGSEEHVAKGMLDRVQYSSESGRDILAIISDLKNARADAPKEGDAVAPIRVDKAHKEIIIPGRCYSDEAHLVGLPIFKLGLDLGYEIWMMPSNIRYTFTEPTKELREFFIGLIIGCDDVINLKLKTSKKSAIEVGRAVALAIRIRGFFRHTEQLGPSALRKNQLFFGNDPVWDPKNKVLKERMILDVQLENYLSDKKDAESASKALVTLLESKGLDGIAENQLEAIIADNLVSHETILDQYRRIPKGDLKPKKRESKKAVKGKLPEKPTSSPLLDKEEIEQINSFLSPLWSSLTPLTQRWSKEVRHSGFKHASDAISLAVKTRWDVLEALSTVTTKRLREIKSQTDDSRLTKRRISVSELGAWLSQRKNGRQKFLSELCVITKAIRSLNKTNCTLINYPWEKVEALHTLQGVVDEERFSRNREDTNVKGAISDDNPWNVIHDVDLEVAQYEASQKILYKADLTKRHEFFQLKLEDMPPTNAYMNLEQFRFILKKVNVSAEIRKKLLIPETEKFTQIKGRKHGPTSLYGKIITYVWKDTSKRNRIVVQYDDDVHDGKNHGDYIVLLPQGWDDPQEDQSDQASINEEGNARGFSGADLIIN